jgi:phage terminase large subunit-like protein
MGLWLKPDYRRFEPNGAQERAIIPMSQGARVELVTFGNRSGKTTFAVNLISNIIRPGSNRYYDYKAIRELGRTKFIRVASDLDNLRETGAIQMELKKWLPPGWRSSKDREVYDSIYEYSDGWRIQLMSYEKEAKQFESVAPDLIWLDEPPPEAIYWSCFSRVMSGTRILITATPWQNSAFLYDAIVLKSDNVNMFHIEGHSEENCKTHGIRGHLEHRDIEFALSQFSSEMREARASGKFFELTGKVFKGFDDSFVIDNPADHYLLKEYGGKIPTSWPRVMVMDPHDKLPPYIMWGTVAPDNSYIFYNEFPQWGRKYEYGDKIISVDNYCALNDNPFPLKMIAEVIRQEETMFGKPMYRIMDPRGSAITYDQEYNIFTFFTQKMGIDFLTKDVRPATSTISAGHKLIIDKIEGRKLWIFGKCKQLIYMMNNYRYKDWYGRAKTGKSSREEVEEKNKHGIDTMRYFCFAMPQYMELPVEEDEKANISFTDYDISKFSRSSRNKSPFSLML